MPLLLCPNDNTSMQSTQRSGVEFDICPTCRGVWLDRGELEKLLAEERGAIQSAAPPPAPRIATAYDRPPERPSYRHDRDDDDDDYNRRPKRRSSIFDIFD